MESVTVAELKAKLSYYLREVRAGKSFTVTSHDVPVAVLGPHGSAPFDPLEVVEPTEDPATWGEVAASLPPIGHEVDVVALLREDRHDRDNRLAETISAGRDKGHCSAPDGAAVPRGRADEPGSNRQGVARRAKLGDGGAA
ncbi:MAG: type II toxin-antitoxin system prevent-host-death family antitoxin [Thermoleophilia bacterium]